MSRRLNSVSFCLVRCVASIALLVTAFCCSPMMAQQADLPALALEAAANFQPIEKEQVEAAFTRLIQDAEAVDRWTANNGSYGYEFREYLEWDKAQEQFAAETPNLGQLLKTQRLLTTDKKGLEQDRFQNAARSLSKYIELASAARPKFAGLYQRRLEQMAKELGQFQEKPTTWLESTIAQQVDFLDRLGSAPALVMAIRNQRNRPNLYADVSASFVTAAVSEPFNQVGDVKDCILGTTIRGSSQTTGYVNVSLVPSHDRAIVEFRSVGHTTSQTRGYHSPIVIRSTGHTDFTASKRVEFTDPIFRVMPSTASATTRTKTRSVQAQSGGLFSGIISNVGRRRTQQSKAQAERIASRHAESRIRSKFDEDLLEEIKGLRRQYRDEFRYPLKRQNAYPEFIRYSSTSQLASAEALQARHGQLAAPSSPPPAPHGNDLAVRVHQSAVSNYVAAIIGGATLSEMEPNEGAHLDVPVPTWIKDMAKDMGGPFKENELSDAPTSDSPTLALADSSPEESAASDKPHKPWSITFRRGRPVSLEFGEDKVTVIVHATRLVSGNEKFAGWDLALTFAMELRDGKLVLTRDGEIDVIPTKFNPDGGKGLPSRDVGLRSNLKKVINDLGDQGDGISSEIIIDPITLSGELADVGTLWFRQAYSNAGWLTVALDRQ